jgi:hypothetical protein
VSESGNKGVMSGIEEKKEREMKIERRLIVRFFKKKNGGKMIFSFVRARTREQKWLF